MGRRIEGGCGRSSGWIRWWSDVERSSWYGCRSDSSGAIGGSASGATSAVVSSLLNGEDIDPSDVVFAALIGAVVGGALNPLAEGMNPMVQGWIAALIPLIMDNIREYGDLFAILEGYGHEAQCYGNGLCCIGPGCPPGESTCIGSGCGSGSGLYGGAGFPVGGGGGMNGWGGSSGGGTGGASPPTNDEC